MGSNYTWNKFTVRINIKNTTVEKLYAAWATRKGIEYWFLRKSEYKTADGTILNDEEPAKEGDTYRWYWHGYGDDIKEEGIILECNGKDLFKFRFGGAGDCTVKIYREQDEMIVELVQDNIPTDEQSKVNWHIGCKTGWTFYLANLKSLCEGGIDLRNKDEHLQNMLNA